MKTSDSGEVISAHCVIMSLINERMEKAYVTCKERERDKEYAREETRGKRNAIDLCKHESYYLYMITFDKEKKREILCTACGV